MNRTRCPWCGKKIDKSKDRIAWSDVIEKRATPRLLRQANCGQCGNKYGQVPMMRYMLAIVISVILLIAFAFVMQSVVLLVASIIPVFGLLLMPYSKLDSTGKPCETNSDLFCEIEIIEKYAKITYNDLYFLDNDFDNFEPFTLASPICFCYASKKNTILGEFLYMNDLNFAYMEQESCLLYDTEMNLAAKIKFVTDGHAN